MSSYSVKIRNAEIQIQKCNEVISEIKKLQDNIATCTNYLGQISNSIESGLIVGGKPADEGKISEIKDELSTVFFDIAPFSKKIKELNSNISWWKFLEKSTKGV